MSKDKASKKPMSPCFLTARFPSVFLGDGPRERLHDTPPAYDKQGHVFYQTELEFVAEKLLEMFRQDNPVPAAVGEPAYGPKVVFEVVNGADVELTRRVRYMGEVQQLEEIRCIGHPDPEAWALFGLPHDRLTVLLVRHYEQARQWEPLVVAALREGNPRDWGQDPTPWPDGAKPSGPPQGGGAVRANARSAIRMKVPRENPVAQGRTRRFQPMKTGLKRPPRCALIVRRWREH